MRTGQQHPPPQCLTDNKSPWIFSESVRKLLGAGGGALRICVVVRLGQATPAAVSGFQPELRRCVPEQQASLPPKLTDLSPGQKPQLAPRQPMWMDAKKPISFPRAPAPCTPPCVKGASLAKIQAAGHRAFPEGMAAAPQDCPLCPGPGTQHQALWPGPWRTTWTRTPWAWAPVTWPVPALLVSLAGAPTALGSSWGC